MTGNYLGGMRLKGNEVEMINMSYELVCSYIFKHLALHGDIDAATGKLYPKGQQQIYLRLT